MLYFDSEEELHILTQMKISSKKNNFPEPEFSFSRNGAGGACFLVENSSTRQKVLQLLLHAFPYRQVTHSHLQTKAPAHVCAVGLSHKSVIHNTYTVTQGPSCPMAVPDRLLREFPGKIPIYIQQAVQIQRGHELSYFGKTPSKIYWLQATDKAGQGPLLSSTQAPFSNSQRHTPSKLKGAGEEIKFWVGFYAKVLKKKDRQETHSFSPQFKNQTVYMSRCNRSHNHKIGGGTQTQCRRRDYTLPAVVDQTLTHRNTLSYAKLLFQVHVHGFHQEVCTEQ